MRGRRVFVRGFVRPLVAVGVIASCAVVAACGGEPSAEDADAPTDAVLGGPGGGADVGESDGTAAGSTDEALATSAGGPGPASLPAPTFDCGATDLGAVRARICGDSVLVRLDQRLDTVFRTALERAEGTAMPSDWIDEMRVYQRDWVVERDACAQAPDDPRFARVADDEAVRRCTESAYLSRIARLEAEWSIARQIAGPVFWACGGDPAVEFVTTLYATEPQAARVDRGEQSEVFLRSPTASGTRYDGFDGKWLWNRGDTATFVWPETDTLRCVVRPPGDD